MSEKINLDKFDDLARSEIIDRFEKYGITHFPEQDRKAILDMLLKHERNQKSKETFIKLLLALFTLVPTILLWLNSQ